MCGIGGELRLDGGEPDGALMGRMLRRLARRGPDHEGTWSDGPLLLGHRRLSVIDLSDRSNQPMVDPELGLALVFNGTIYNYRELRRELLAKGYRFFSEGDTEVILKAYAEWGERCVEHLIGMFAFAIWNLRERTPVSGARPPGHQAAVLQPHSARRSVSPPTAKPCWKRRMWIRRSTRSVCTIS
jgi:asparagine synthase (glutamine-hydrolysing)